jgi:hypothetical protein
LCVPVQALSYGKVGERQCVRGISVDCLLQKIDCLRIVSLANGDLSEFEVCR